MDKLKLHVGNIYERFLQEKYEEFKAIDDDLGKRYLAEISEKEERLLRDENDKFISSLKFLNELILKELRDAPLDIGHPKFVRAYGLIYSFLMPVIRKYEKESMIYCISKGGNYATKSKSKN